MKQWLMVVMIAGVLTTSTTGLAKLDLPKLTLGNNLNEQQIIDGLKEALQVGSKNAVSSTGKLDALVIRRPSSLRLPEVGVTRKYKELVIKAKSIPFFKIELVDIDQYIVVKSLDGLFYMVSEEEKKIRKDPVAQVTNILKKVFGKSN